MVNAIIAVFIGIIITFHSTFALAFETKAKQAILIDHHSGEIIYSKNSQAEMHPSSMSKLMTVYITFKKLSSGELKPNQTFVISRKAWKTNGSKMFLNQGDIVTAIDLIKGVIVLSGNDAAVALAEAIAGTEDNFVKLMNEEAINLKLENSNFVNASGLTHKKHYMSAHDIAKLSIALYDEFPEYFHLFSIGELTHANITQPNRNSILSEEGVDGLKTGVTDAGGFGLAFTASKNGRRVIGVVNGLKNHQERHNEAKKMLDFAYNDTNAFKIADKNQAVVDIPVYYGSKSSVKAMVKENIGYVNKDGESRDIKFTAAYKAPIQAPIFKDDIIGYLKISENDIEKEFPLFATEDVLSAGFLRKIYQNLLLKLGV